MLASVYAEKSNQLPPVCGPVFGEPVERIMSHRYVYDVHKGTFYGPGTRREVIETITTYMGTNVRLRFHYGNPTTGADWGDIFDVAGRIGRSTGPNAIPLLATNSTGGGSILTDNVVRIRFANRKDGGDLFRHETYTPPNPANYTPAEYSKHFA